MVRGGKCLKCAKLLGTKQFLLRSHVICLNCSSLCVGDAFEVNFLVKSFFSGCCFVFVRASVRVCVCVSRSLHLRQNVVEKRVQKRGAIAE